MKKKKVRRRKWRDEKSENGRKRKMSVAERLFTKKRHRNSEIESEREIE